MKVRYMMAFSGFARQLDPTPRCSTLAPESYRFVSTYPMLIASHGTAHHVPLVGYRPKRKSLRKNSQRKVPSVT